MTLLQCDNLSVSIANQTVCSNLDLTIQAGEVWGLLGRNGVGKTTFLHTTAGLHKSDEGSILLNKHSIESLNRRDIAKQLGLLLQQTEESFPCRVLDAVLTGRHPHIDTFAWESTTDIEIAKQALSIVDLQNMETRNIDQLSGGEKQRVAIASLIAQSPDIYLLDEPNTHLDLKHQIQLMDYFKSLAVTQNKSVITTLHDINLAQRYCSHIIMFFGDGSVCLGKAEDLINADTLSKLYQHKLYEANTDQGKIFLPDPHN
jgi:iron complex transport system ATP-binding protein